MGSPIKAVLIRSERREAVAFPSSVLRTQSFSCLPSCSTLFASSGRAKLFFVAKACAAFVGDPLPSKATLVGGPQFTTSLSGAFTSKFRTRTASRRGAAKEETSSNARLALSNPFKRPEVSASDSLSSAFGGNSSVPSSNRKSLLILTLLHDELELRLQLRDRPMESRPLGETQSNPVQHLLRGCEHVK